MARHELNLALDLPEHIMTLDEVRGMAALYGVTLDDWVSRCIVEYTRQAALAAADPELQAFYDLHKEQGPVNLTPESRRTAA